MSRLYTYFKTIIYKPTWNWPLKGNYFVFNGISMVLGKSSWNLHICFKSQFSKLNSMNDCKTDIHVSNLKALDTLLHLLCQMHLIHWVRVTHICISKLSIIGSDNGLSPGWRQAITWTNAGILLIGSLGKQLQWNLNRNIFIQEKASESVVCETAAILSRPQWVNLVRSPDGN